jgi:CspA family cold shock protein
VTGTVAQFDVEKGYGSVRADDGTVYFFHCTAISGGSRTIDEGRRVTFEVVAGHLGRWEAAEISPEL